MKTLHKLLWACCLTASLTACKDDTDTLLPSDELPPLPTDIITGRGRQRHHRHPRCPRQLAHAAD